jgi:hypothetical protein
MMCVVEDNSYIRETSVEPLPMGILVCRHIRVLLSFREKVGLFTDAGRK